MSMQPIQKIIWAVDAFSEDTALQLKLLRQLKNLADTIPVTIQPVMVLSPDQLNMPPNLFAELSESIEVTANKELVHLTEKHKVPGMQKPEILLSKNNSLRAAVEILNSYAKKTSADLVAVSTQSKKGVTHFLFGSFAETLILQSEIPIFVINPSLHNLKRNKSILFPTDLSEASRVALEEVIKMAQERKFSVVLFNRVEYHNQFAVPDFDAGAYTTFLENNVVVRKQDLEALSEYARGKGVKIEWRLDESLGSSVSEAIVTVAKKMRVNLIAMASRSGPIASTILGSTTRSVVRSASCPIWVLRPGPGSGEI